MAKERDLSNLFSKCISIYADAVGEEPPFDPGRNIAALIGMKDGYGKPILKSNAVFNKNKLYSQNSINTQMINQHHPENAMDINQITQNVVKSLMSSPELMSQLGGDPNKIQNIVRSEVNSKIARNNGNTYNNNENLLKQAQKSELISQGITEFEQPYQEENNDDEIRQIIKQLNDFNKADLIELKSKIAITLTIAQIKNMAKNNGLESLRKLINLGLVSEKEIEYDELFEYQLTGNGKIVVNYLLTY